MKHPLSDEAAPAEEIEDSNNEGRASHLAEGGRNDAEQACKDHAKASASHEQDDTKAVPPRWEGKSSGDFVTLSCRVCLEEDPLERLCQPCCCTGSMGHAHPACIQRWVDECGSLCCEICKQPYQGHFNPPPPQLPQAAEPRLPLIRGFLIADPESGTVIRRTLQEDHADLDQEQSSATWCLAAVLIFMTLLLLRHTFEVFGDSGTYNSKPTAAPSRKDIPDGAVSFAWGPLNSSRGWDSDAWDSAVLFAAAAPGDSPVNSPGEEDISPWLLLAWLLLRFAIVLIPALLAYRLMASFRAAQRQDADRRESSVLWNMEAGVPIAPLQPDREGGIRAGRHPAQGSELLERREGVYGHLLVAAAAGRSASAEASSTQHAVHTVGVSHSV